MTFEIPKHAMVCTKNSATSIDPFIFMGKTLGTIPNKQRRTHRWLKLSVHSPKEGVLRILSARKPYGNDLLFLLPLFFPTLLPLNAASQHFFPFVWAVVSFGKPMLTAVPSPTPVASVCQRERHKAVVAVGRGMSDGTYLDFSIRLEFLKKLLYDALTFVPWMIW